jgi:carbon-monoxide dehydrogenase iron sulfur subunit
MQNTRKIYAITAICAGCRTCEIACAVAHSKSGILIGAVSESPLPRYRMDVQAYEEKKLPLNCRHCDEPDCLFACKAGAVSKHPESGQVKVDLEKCVGCWMCVMVCPFGVAVSDDERCKVVKCDLCDHREEGPACVSACPTHALIYGTADEVEAYLKQLKKQSTTIKIA